VTALVLRGDARRLPLPDESVDLICTSPPYYGLRSYTDEGYCAECRIMRENGRDPRQAWPDYQAHWDAVHKPRPYAGQIGSEATPREYVAALTECTREWVRVLKPSGSIFVNLGDKYSGGGSGENGTGTSSLNGHGGQGTARDRIGLGRSRPVPGARPKSLLGLPWRYALACTDQLGLILRAEIIWAKPNGLPESVTDRVRRGHEQVFHLVRQPRYYSAVDEIREPYRPETVRTQAYGLRGGMGGRAAATTPRPGNGAVNPLGALPGSVWNIPSQPLTVPAHLGTDHFAAFPFELPRRIIAGWSPPGVCTGCGQGRRPVSVSERIPLRPGDAPGRAALNGDAAHGFDRRAGTHMLSRNTITGYACACTPYTDHDGTGRGHKRTGDTMLDGEGWASTNELGGSYANYERVGPWREYHFDRWTPAPTRPSLVVDPFGGTGSTALIASVLGRTGISVDLSHDYTRLARWRTTDPAERARAMQVPKPPPVPDGQESMFEVTA